MKLKYFLSSIFIGLLLASSARAGNKRQREPENISSLYKRARTAHSLAQDASLENALRILTTKTNLEKKDPQGQTPLHKAAKEGNLTISKLLVDWGADVHTADDQGWTPFHIATYTQNISIMCLLASKGATPNTIGPAGYTPLHSAIAQGHIHAVNILIMMNVKTDCFTEAGQLPLHICASKGDTDIAQSLLNNGVNIDATSSKENQTALHFSINPKREAMTRLLLEKGASVDMVDKYGATPLHVATEKKYINGAKLLLKYQADVNRPNGMGMSPLHIAIRNNDYNMIQLLLSQGADISKKDTYLKFTPLEFYLKMHNPCEHIVKALFDFSNLNYLHHLKHSKLLKPHDNHVQSRIQKAFSIIAKEYTHLLLKQKCASRKKGKTWGLALALLLHHTDASACTPAQQHISHTGLMSALQHSAGLLKSDTLAQNMITKILGSIRPKLHELSPIDQASFELELAKATRIATHESLLSTITEGIQRHIGNHNRTRLEQQLLACNKQEHIKLFLSNLARYGPTLIPSFFKVG